MSKKNAHKGFGGPPMFATRILEALTEGKLDWRTLLNDFVQEEICDYSFSPPDRRFGDSDFFLPDFNDFETETQNMKTDCLETCTDFDSWLNKLVETFAEEYDVDKDQVMKEVKSDSNFLEDLRFEYDDLVDMLD